MYSLVCLYVSRYFAHLLLRMTTTLYAFSPGFKMRTNLLALALSGLLSCCSADESSTTPLERRQSLNGNIYIGCLFNPSVAVLGNFGGVSQTGMTLQKCSIACFNYVFWGVINGDSCYCSNSLPGGTSLHANANCNAPCSGNNLFGTSESCGSPSGGTSYYSVFQKATAVPDIPPTPSYNQIGCYAEGLTSILDDSIMQMPQSNAQTCETLCTGFRFFGLRSANTCICGNTIDNTARIGPAAACDVVCLNGPTQNCGSSDSSHNNIYARSDLTACAQLNTKLRVRNPGFENGIAFWSDQGLDFPRIRWQSIKASELGSTGKRVARITSHETSARLTLSQTVPVCPGTGYILSFWGSARNGGPCTVELSLDDGDPISLEVVDFATGRRGYVSPTLLDTKLDILVYCAVSGSPSTMFLDNIELRPATSDDALLFPPIGT